MSDTESYKSSCVRWCVCVCESSLVSWGEVMYKIVRVVSQNVHSWFRSSRLIRSKVLLTDPVITVYIMLLGGGDDEVRIQRRDPAAWCSMLVIHSDLPGRQATSFWSRTIALSCLILLSFLKYAALASVHKHDLHVTGRLATRAMLQPGWGGQGYENWWNNEICINMLSMVNQELLQLHGTRHKRYKSVRMQALIKLSKLIQLITWMLHGCGPFLRV